MLYENTWDLDGKGGRYAAETTLAVCAAGQRTNRLASAEMRGMHHGLSRRIGSISLRDPLHVDQWYLCQIACKEQARTTLMPTHTTAFPARHADSAPTNPDAAAAARAHKRH